MKLGYLLDTSVVSVPISKRPNPRVLDRLAASSGRCAICSHVWHELVCGARRLSRGRRRDALDAYLAEVVRTCFPILPYDEAAATWHGKERARQQKAGKPAPFVDGEIAAVAYTNGLTLATLNPRHFELFQHLRVEDWSEAR
jgi:tRNA(fMet)-specific endonuclease VapC